MNERLSRIGRSRNILRLGDSSPKAPYRLICFPEAGCSLRNYRTWPRLVEGTAEVLGIMPPGRMFRLHDPLETDLRAFAKKVVDDLVTEGLLDRPYVLYGHSIGGLTAYECLCELTDAGYPSPLALAIGSTPAPHLVPHVMGEPVAHSPGKTRQRLIELGMDSQKLSEPSMELLWPSIFADFMTFESYRHDEPDGPPLNTPLLVWAGSDDKILKQESIVAWEAYTSVSPMQYTCVPAGHFYTEEQAHMIVPPIMTYLRIQGAVTP